MNTDQRKATDIDTRVKIILTLAFLLSLNLLPQKQWPFYILYLSLLYGFSISQRVEILVLLKRSLIALPFIISALPLIFAPDSFVNLQIVGYGWNLPISMKGFQKFASIFIKSWLSVQGAVQLSMSTNIPDLINGMQYLKVPKIFITIALLMWRYLSVLVHEATAMMTARSSRSGVNSGSKRSGGNILWRARVTGSMAGSLFIRSIDRSERVFAAMQSRGYNGELPFIYSNPISRTSKFQIASGILILILLLFFGTITGG